MSDSETAERLTTELRSALKARDELRVRTVRSLLAAIQVEEKSGKVERRLDEGEVLTVLGRELKRRRESAGVFAGAGREDLASREADEASVISGFLPSALTPEEVAELVRDAVEETGARSVREMGAVMRVLAPRTRGRVEGGALSAEVRRQLG